MNLKDVGKRVVVIGINRDYDSNFLPFPMIGTLGTIIDGLDEDDEYEILFDNYPCMRLDPAWTTHKNMIIFLNDYGNKSVLVKETTTN